MLSRRGSCSAQLTAISQGVRRSKKECSAGKKREGEIEKAQQAARGVGREILRTEGVKGLFREGALRGVWTALGSGLYLAVYESDRRYLEGRRVGVDEGSAP